MSDKSIQQFAVGKHAVTLSANGATLEGVLAVPEQPRGIILFAHGSGSSRHSPRNQYVAEVLYSHRVATLLFDLLTRDEEPSDRYNQALRFNIPFLANRLIGATKWIMDVRSLKDLKIGYFGASTGAGAALMAAAKLPEAVCAIVSRGGRPDLAADFLHEVHVPTLLIVGGDDEPVIAMNHLALQKIGCADKKLIVIPGASHLFQEPGTLEEVAKIATHWFCQHFAASETPDSAARRATGD
ncbi:MAG TPA: dienelactone hydrolase family protein [Terriglobales bacterium]|jgi:dienelactone hydrolase|nr:dienelactone hydrolase family protein [Terriglobales bacterium]HZP31807.1 dienelactone hydrolase family protein [Candidatus Acidoferrales bacterium]